MFHFNEIYFRFLYWKLAFSMGVSRSTLEQAGEKGRVTVNVNLVTRKHFEFW